MKIKDLIEELEEVKEKHGNIETHHKLIYEDYKERYPSSIHKNCKAFLIVGEDGLDTVAIPDEA